MHEDFLHCLQTFYIDKETGTVYADANKSSHEFDFSESQCFRKGSDIVFWRTVLNWWDNISGNYIINDEIIEKVRIVLGNNK